MNKKKGLESGIANIITDVNGDGELVIAFENPFDYVDYAAKLTANQADDTAIFDVTSKTINGFTAGVDTSEKISTEVVDASGVNLTFNDYSKEVIDASGNTITFGDADPDTIVRNSGDWRTRFVDGDFITVADDGSNVNAGTYEIATVVALTLTLILAEELTGEVNTTDTFTFTVVEPTIPSTIVRASGNWDTLFNAGEIITVSDDGSDINAGSYLVDLIATVTMTLALAEVIIEEANSTDTFTFVTNNGVKAGWIASQNVF